MSGLTLTQAQAQLDAWLAASLAVASSQSYSIAGRSLTRANASEIKSQLVYWENRVRALSNGRSGRARTRYFVT